MEIIVPDMGHGNCVGIFVDDSALLVDCGAEDNKVKNFTNLIENKVRKTNKKDLIITHYHCDHYNLIDRFPRKFFDNIYVPSLPPKTTTAQAIFEFIALAIVTFYKKYYLFPQLLSAGKIIHPRIKGDTFTTINKEWDVLWPHYEIVNVRNKVKIETIRRKIREIKNILDPNKQEEFDRWCDILSKSFSKEQKQSKDIPRKISKEGKVDKEILKGLVTIEKIFKDIANRASLVTRDDDFDFLFTGDIDDVILNNYLQFGDNHYFLIEAPHHGGYYGNAFDNTSTDILVISRKSKYKPRAEYFRELPWRILVDTARIGNSIINRKSHHKDIQFISIEDDKASAYFAFHLL